MSIAAISKFLVGRPLTLRLVNAAVPRPMRCSILHDFPINRQRMIWITFVGLGLKHPPEIRPKMLAAGTGGFGLCLEMCRKSQSFRWWRPCSEREGGGDLIAVIHPAPNVRNRSPVGVYNPLHSDPPTSSSAFSSLCSFIPFNSVISFTYLFYIITYLSLYY